MANKNIFNKSAVAQSNVPVANATNLAGGKAYSLTAKQAIAQYAVTGTFNGTYYADADQHLKSIQGLFLDKTVDAAFIAKLAVYSRQSAYMKDMPAFLLAVLSTKDVALFKKAFPLVIDNSKMLRNFVQIVRSGALGRKSLGSAPKKAIKAWFDARTDEQLFSDSVGNDPSLVDVIRLAHVKPNSNVRETLFKYFMGNEISAESKGNLPKIVQEYEDFKVNFASKAEAPKVPFQMLTSLPLTETHWKKIATDAKWQMTRMNLNTFARHGVFKDSSLTKLIADRLADEGNVKHAKVFPYQLFAAYKTVDDSVPVKVKNALQDAMEHAVKNVPSFNGKKIFVGVDVSGSMQSPITGTRGTATSKINCNEVAALIAAAMVKANDNTEVLQFDTACKPLKGLNARDSVMTNISKISFSGGGTDCSSVLRHLNSNAAKGDFVVIVSDNESWMEFYNSGFRKGTGLAHEWATFKTRNPKAKLICIDMQPNLTAQIKPAQDVLCVGGFSDNVFSIMEAFADNEKNDPDFWVSKIEQSSQIGF